MDYKPTRAEYLARRLNPTDWEKYDKACKDVCVTQPATAAISRSLKRAEDLLNLMQAESIAVEGDAIARVLAEVLPKEIDWQHIRIAGKAAADILNLSHQVASLVSVKINVDETDSSDEKLDFKVAVDFCSKLRQSQKDIAAKTIGVERVFVGNTLDTDKQFLKAVKEANKIAALKKVVHTLLNPEIDPS